jgi:hypothetical protein
MDVDKGHKGVSAIRHERTTSFIMLIIDIAQDLEPDGYLTDVTSISTADTPNSYVPSLPWNTWFIFVRVLKIMGNLFCIYFKIGVEIEVLIRK